MKLVASYQRLLGTVSTLAFVVALGFAGYAGFYLTRAQVAAEVYRDRLTQLNQDYEALRSRYNEAVRRTAVTELVVADGRLSVHVRTAEGVLKEIPTPIDPQQEVYVDYIVLDGRLWIRRVFDDRTPPANGVVIDPSLASIDWEAGSATHGKAVYRQLDEGRWIVTVTGGGALGLRRSDRDARAELAPPPDIEEYREVEAEVRDQVERIGVVDVVRRLIGR